MTNLFGVGLDQRDRGDTHPVGIVRQTKTQAEMHHVKQHDKDHGAKNGSL